MHVYFILLCASLSMIQEPSVALAIQLLDGASFRPGGKTLMSVSVAKFQQKGKFTIYFSDTNHKIYITNVLHLLQVTFF